jgi:hypothetical protein
MRTHPSTVLSVPAGKSYDFIFEHLIYSCPVAPAYEYKDAELIAFRRASGHMEQVLTIGKIHTLRPEDIDAEYSIREEERARISAYITVARKSGVLDKGDSFRFYILGDEPVAMLPHRPAPKSPLKGAAYFRLADLTSGNPAVVPFLVG